MIHMEKITRNLPDGWMLEANAHGYVPRMFRLTKNGVTVAHVQEFDREGGKWSVYSHASNKTEARSVIDTVLAAFRHAEDVDLEARRARFFAEVEADKQARARSAEEVLFGEQSK